MSDDYNAIPLHDDCVVCHAENAQHEAPGGETRVLLMMMRGNGTTPDDMYYGLCFFHRRQLDDLIAAMLEQKP